MARSGRSKYAILGMLCFGEKSGYDLKQEFERRMSGFWAESLGQIYPTLHRLEAEGLVTKRSAPQDTGRDRVLYRVTAAGKRVLKDWLGETPHREQVRHELLLKLFFGEQTGVETALEHLAHYEAIQRQLRSLYRGFDEEIESENVSDEAKTFWRVTLLSGKYVNDARLRWCRDAREMLEELEERRARSRRRGRSST